MRRLVFRLISALSLISALFMIHLLSGGTSVRGAPLPSGAPSCSAYEQLRCLNGDGYPIHLTFDDGPKDGMTDQVLDVLKEEKVPATFFVFGERLEDSLRNRSHRTSWPNSGPPMLSLEYALSAVISTGSLVLRILNTVSGPAC